MSKQVDTKAVRCEKNGIQGWEKTCPFCHKKFFTTSRRQKYCSPECGKKYQEKKKKQQEQYSKSKDVQRLWARSHSLSVEIVKQLVVLGKREWKCDCCGSTENLQVHHKDINFLNLSPSNLQLLCPKCHSKVHSELDKSLNEQGVLLEEYYDQSIQPFMKVLGRSSHRKS